VVVAGVVVLRERGERESTYQLRRGTPPLAPSLKQKRRYGKRRRVGRHSTEAPFFVIAAAVAAVSLTALYHTQTHGDFKGHEQLCCFFFLLLLLLFCDNF
jgi:hypothetical protein